MLFSLFLSFAIGPDWHKSSNHPGWEAFGVLSGNRLDHPERWRRTSDHSIEYILDGDPVPGGYTKVVDAQQAASVAPGEIVEPVRPGGDPYGFVVWLNAVRGGWGLGGVAWSDEMAGWALRNSSVGFGHAIMGTARRQNAGWGELWTVCNAWLAHGPHAAALLDPTITQVGIAAVGVVWTFSAR